MSTRGATRWAQWAVAARRKVRDRRVNAYARRFALDEAEFWESRLRTFADFLISTWSTP